MSGWITANEFYFIKARVEKTKKDPYFGAAWAKNSPVFNRKQEIKNPDFFLLDKKLFLLL